MTLENNRAPLLCYVKLCASFQSHQWIKTYFTVWKRSSWVEIGDFFVPCDIEIWRMTLKNNRAPLLCCFRVCASFHSHQWIQTLKSGNAEFGSKSAIFCPMWHWNLIDGLKNNRVPVLYYFKLCASFCSHLRIQIGVTVRKRPIWVKIDDHLSRVTLKFDACLWKTIEHLFYVTSSFVHPSVAIGEFELKWQSGKAQFESKSTIVWAVWPRILTDDLGKQ